MCIKPGGLGGSWGVGAGRLLEGGKLWEMMWRRSGGLFITRSGGRWGIFWCN